MNPYENYHGYKAEFLGDDFQVEFPKVDIRTASILAQKKDGSGVVLDYKNYSVLQHAARKLPLLTATNIDGSKLVKVPRRKIGDNWKLDRRIKLSDQLGNPLYRADHSDFDKGHMTKREDVQWGETEEEAIEGAKSTFYYTNAAPQHGNLNRREWLEIENYILHDQSVASDLKVTVFTGPILSDSDPEFVTQVNGETIQLPTLFWKVVYFTKSDGELCRVSFLYGQRSLLEEGGIIISERGRRTEDDLFMDFEDSKTYQVKTEVIERLTNFNFARAVDPYDDDRPLELIIEEVNVRGAAEPEKYLRGMVL